MIWRILSSESAWALRGIDADEPLIVSPLGIANGEVAGSRS